MLNPKEFVTDLSTSFRGKGPDVHARRADPPKRLERRH